MSVAGADHLPLAMPAGREAEARAFPPRVYVDDPFGNRLELMERLS